MGVVERTRPSSQVGIFRVQQLSAVSFHRLSQEVLDVLFRYFSHYRGTTAGCLCLVFLNFMVNDGVCVPDLSQIEPQRSSHGAGAAVAGAMVEGHRSGVVAQGCTRLHNPSASTALRPEGSACHDQSEMLT